MVLQLSSCEGSVTDKSSKLKVESITYKVVKIGSQVWMTENLNVEKFRNGAPIPEAKSNEEWILAAENKQPAWCYYNNDPKNGAKYGKLYNWFAIQDSRGLAPNGFHVPTVQNWLKLIKFLGGEEIAGEKMKSTDGWIQRSLFDGLVDILFKGLIKKSNGSNSSGFNGIPSGCRDFNGRFDGLGHVGYWWSSSSNTSDLNYLDINADDYNSKFSVSLDRLSTYADLYCWGDDYGHSVRCIKD
jgi:uncharacterized protein (TIGR02145 family)